MRNLSGVVTDRYSNDDAQHTDWVYDSLGRIQTMTVRGVGGAVEATQAFQYYPHGDVAQLVQTIGPSSRTLDYDYDSKHQLMTAGEPGGVGFQANYYYSPAGRLSDVSMQPGGSAPQLLTHRARDVHYEYGGPTGGTGTADPQAVDELRNTNGDALRARFIYDLSGNVIRREEPFTAGGTMPEPTDPEDVVGDVWEFVYDGDDQQRRVIRSGATETYFYTHDFQRYLAVEADASQQHVRTRFFFGPTEVWYGPGGAVEKTLTTISLGQSVARIERAGSTEDRTFLYHSTLEHLIVGLDDTDSVEVGFFYGPFGEILQEVGAFASFDRQFNDKHHDGISALSYYGYRYYDSLSLSWTQADPLYRFEPDRHWSEPRDANLYVFSGNNPLRYYDPDGREKKSSGSSPLLLTVSFTTPGELAGTAVAGVLSNVASAVSPPARAMTLAAEYGAFLALRSERWPPWTLAPCWKS